MLNLAVLDEQGVLTGFEEIEAENHTPPPDRVEVPGGCDLVPGRYRWDGDQFVPIPLRGGAGIPEEPNTLRAIARGFMALRDQGTELPGETLDWISWYERSIDNQGGN